MDPQGLPGTGSGHEPESYGLVLGQAGHLGHQVCHEAAGASLVPGSTGASLVLSLLTPKSMAVGLVPGIIGEGLKPESTGMSLTLGL